MTNYITILNKELPRFCNGKISLSELVGICIEDSINDTSIAGRSRVNKIIDEISSRISKLFRLNYFSMPHPDSELDVCRFGYRGESIEDFSMSLTGMDLFKRLRELDKIIEDRISKNFTTNDDLKKFTPQERQNFIVDQLTYLINNRVSRSINVRETAELILKAYLLDCGEGIDVDFSKEDKINDTEMWLASLETAINEIPDHTKSLSSNTAQKGLNLMVEAGDFVKLVKADLDKKNKSEVKSFSQRLMECM